jgi:hypothetical protein
VKPWQGRLVLRRLAAERGSLLGQTRRKLPHLVVGSLIRALEMTRTVVQTEQKANHE